MSQQISVEVLREKYAKGGEATLEEVRRRVARALSVVEKDPTYWEARFFEAMEAGFIPGGRINSAAGTGIGATLINCFVQPVGDAMSETDPESGKPGITAALGEAAETMRRGGGVGYDFSQLRPAGARVKGTDSLASGPLSYMRMFDAMCRTVESAGSRRGAQMGVLRCDHPDIEAFIGAKAKPYHHKDLTQFNLSVAVTDAFMRSVEEDGEIALVHRAEPGEALRAAGAYRRDDGLWVYRRVRARALWDQIMRSTYDFADPGVLFIDRVNQENNLWYCERIETTNPCVTADTWVMTSNGPEQVARLIGRPFAAVVNGKTYPTESQGFFSTGTKPVYRLETREGMAVRLTANHPMLKVTRQTRYTQETEWVKAGEIQPGDRLVTHDHSALTHWAGEHSQGVGYLMGLLVGDGCIKEDKAVLSVWEASSQMAANGDPVSCDGVQGIKDAVLRAVEELPKRSDFIGWQRPIEDRGECRLALGALRDIALDLGVRPGNKGIPPAMERCSSEFYRGFLRGLFDADGSVQGTQQKGVSVRLTQVSETTLQAVQRMLLRLGIVSRIYRYRKRAGYYSLPDGIGGMKEYYCNAVHELVISGESIAQFSALIGFEDLDKCQRLHSLMAVYKRAMNRERFLVTATALVPDGVEAVYDVTVSQVHAFDANGLVVHNCGEQPLPDYGCCDLGSINLTRFVDEPFTPEAAFRYEGFEEVVGTAIRMLDNVLDLTLWPLEKQRAEAVAKRRVGLGFTGLGDALIMLGLKYDTDEARDQAARIARVMRDAAYRASVGLAKEKGAFPRFDADHYLDSGFLRRMPEEIREQIRKHGIRSSHLLSIAPTGTISLVFGDNCSSGIEPVFSWFYQRKVRQGDGSTRSYRVYDPAYLGYKTLRGWSHRPDEQVVSELPPWWVSAMAIPAADHAAMSAAVAPYIDTAISKTVNVAEDYPYEDFQAIYRTAWRHGLKGITTYRPSTQVDSVLSTVGTESQQAPDFDQSDPDRRIHLENLPEPALASLRWRKRPQLPGGNPSWTYMVTHPHGYHFAVFVGHIENQDNYPFEVWVNGAEAPRGLGALAKSLSMDMRSNDRHWLKTKLDSLARAGGDDAFDLAMPPDGHEVRVPSIVAGFATLVRYRCQELGAFEGDTPSPVLDALMSPKEPKTGPDGTLSWTVDIYNPSTGDDFVLGLKEAVLPDGSRRPYSVWLSGEYPRTLDGLCKSLSYDMRVVDPAWCGAKLRQLLDFQEHQGELFAREPGSRKSVHWPSTVAYMARLIIHRYAQLGILDEEGFPMDEMGVMTMEVDNVVPLRSAGATEVMSGKRCPECGNYAVIKKDGCDFCTACGAQGLCG